MRKRLLLFMTVAVIACLSACSNTNSANDTTEQSKNSSQQIEIESDSSDTQSSESENSFKTASDDANIQTENSNMPTRIIENGTKINMHFGDTIIPSILNDSETAQALIDMLPYTVHVSRYSRYFCGVMDDPLPYREENVNYGWLNGDIDFATNADYFTILFEDEEQSEQYGYQVNIGVIDCELSKLSELQGNYDVLIELAE